MIISLLVEGTEAEREQVNDVIKFFRQFGTVEDFVDSTAKYMLEDGFYTEEQAKQLNFELGDIYERVGT